MCKQHILDVTQPNEYLQPIAPDPWPDRSVRVLAAVGPDRPQQTVPNVGHLIEPTTQPQTLFAIVIAQTPELNYDFFIPSCHQEA
jgi:hypothetical protein